MDILFNENYTTMWTAVSSIMGIIATMMAVFALLYSIRTYRKTMQVVHYGEIDKMYFDILKEALEKPHLVQKGGNKTAEQLAQYEIFAFIVWNFLEAIYDRCLLDKTLKTTWYPIIETERSTHLEWLQRPENKKKFKDEFLTFIDKGDFSTSA